IRLGSTKVFLSTTAFTSVFGCMPDANLLQIKRSVHERDRVRRHKGLGTLCTSLRQSLSVSSSAPTQDGNGAGLNGDGTCRISMFCSLIHRSVCWMLSDV